MKTGLLLLGLTFNITLCCLPFEQKDITKQNPYTLKAQANTDDDTLTESKDYSYITFLKNKAKQTVNHKSTGIN